MQNIRKHNILFIESGQANSGSFESLYQHLRYIDRRKISPFVIFINEGPYFELVKQLHIPVFLFTDSIYCNNCSVRKKIFYLFLLFVCKKIAPIFFIFIYSYVHRDIIRNIRKVVKQNSIDLIHLNDQPARDTFGIIAAYKEKKACISHIRSRDVYSLNKQQVKFINKSVDRFFAASNDVKKIWCDKGIGRNQVEVLYNGISNVTASFYDIKKEYNITGNIKYTVGCFGRLIWWKNQIFLINAFAELLKEYNNVVLFLVGDGPDIDMLRNRTIQLGITENVVFTGYRKNSKEIISSVDLLVLPSLNDVCSRVLLEGLVLKTPIIAVNSGGNSEVIDHNHNGILINNGDIRNLTRSMKKILTGRQFKNYLTENGYRIVQEKFSIEKYVKRINIVYDNILMNKRNSN